MTLPELLALGNSGLWKSSAEILVWVLKTQMGDIARNQAEFCKKPACKAISRTRLLYIKKDIKIATLAWSHSLP